MNTVQPSSSPLVSAIVPAYNHESFVAETLQAIEDQTYPNLEIIVVDDGSTDRTPEVVQEFLGRSKRPTRFVRQPNSGLAKTFARGFVESRGDLVAFCDSDDVWFLDKTERQVQAMRDHDVDAVLGNHLWWNGHATSVYREAQDFRESWDPEAFIAALVQSRGPGLQGGLFKRNLLEAIGGPDQGLPLNDWPVLIRAARHARRIRVDPEPVFRYRIHPGNFTTSRQRELLRWKMATARRFCSRPVVRSCGARAHRLVADGLLASGRPWQAAFEFALARAYGPQPDTRRFLYVLRRDLKRSLRGDRGGKA